MDSTLILSYRSKSCYLGFKASKRPAILVSRRNDPRLSRTSLLRSQPRSGVFELYEDELQAEFELQYAHPLNENIFNCLGPIQF